MPAEIQHRSPTQVEGFLDDDAQPRIAARPLALTEAFVKQANENQIKQQEDAGAKRTNR